MQYTRTTITIPEHLLQEAKIEAVRRKKPVSKLFEEGIKIVINPAKEKSGTAKKKKIHMLLGKYSWGTTDTFRRADIYAEHLKHKFPR